MTVLLKQFGVAALYALFMFLDHRYLEGVSKFTLFEPASGLALAVLLIGGKRYAWAVLLGAVLANAAAVTFWEATIISLADTLEAFCAAWLLMRDNKFDPAIQSLRDYLHLILLSAASIAVSGNIEATALLAFGFIPAEAYFHELTHWWLGDMLGIILITPLILVCWPARNNLLKINRIAEPVLLLGLMFLVGQIVFFDWFHDSLGNVAKGYVMFLFIIWVAMRFGTHGTVVAINIIGIQALLGAYQGAGYFANDISQAHLTNYWLYMTTLSVVGMALATFISEHKRSEKALRQSELKFRTLYDSTSEAVMLMDEKGFFDCNDAALAMFGCATKEEFCTKHPVDLSPPQQPDGTSSLLLANQYIAMAQEKGSLSFDWMCKRLDTGKTFIIDGMLSAMELDGKAVLQAVSRDITERRHNEERLWQSKERLRAYLDNISDTIWVVRANLDMAYVSSGVTRLLGVLPEDLIGLPSARYIHPDDMDVIGNAMQYLMEHPGEPKTVQYRVKHKDGRWISVESTGINLLANPAINGVLVAMRDITERKAAEQRLRDLSVHMLEVREEEKARIAREIHDELGGTLAALKMDAYWLSRKLPANDETAVHIERIKSMSQRIDSAISITRRVMTDLRPSILDDLGLLPALEWQAEEFYKHSGIECRVSCIENEANLDKQRSIALFRILQEVLTNVSRHSGASKVEIKFHHGENEVILIVNDNGCGIEANHLATAKSYGMLGMTERVEQLGGKIIFNSPQEGGFIVAVTLPLPAGKESI